MSKSRYIYFLAHAGKDKEPAKELRDLLHPDIKVFLDICDLDPGDRWGVHLSKYQQQALATVAILSSTVDSARYLEEEIANAIAYQRHDETRHRLIPVYLDGLPKSPFEVPYGVRGLHALDAAQLGMAGVATELRKFAASLKDAPPVSLPEDLPKPADRFAITDALCKLLESQFNEVIFRVAAPNQHLAPAGQPLMTRATDLVLWAEQGGASRIAELCQAIRSTAPGVL